MPSLSQKSPGVKLDDVVAKVDPIQKDGIRLLVREELAAIDVATKGDLVALSQRMSMLQDELELNLRRPSVAASARPSTMGAGTSEDMCIARPASSAESGMRISASLDEMLKSRRLRHTQMQSHSRLAYTLHRSLWDASLLIGAPGLGVGASLALCACLVINLCLVSMLIPVIANISKADVDQSTVDEYNLWRATVAHDVSLRNPVTGESLASGVCNAKLSTPYSNMQLLVLSELDKYLSEIYRFPLQSFSRGGMMCGLALIVWHFKLSVEIRDILHWSHVCFGLRYNPNIDIMGSDTCDRLMGICTWRKIMVLMFAVIRLCVVALLAWFGSSFVINEISVEEMLLNAVSLELILNLDELIYSALAPQLVKSVVERLAPLEFNQPSFAWYKYGEFVVLSLVITTVICLELACALTPFVDLLRASRNALCGGDDNSLNFVMAVDAIGIPWAAVAPTPNRPGLTYAEHAVDQAKKLGFASTTNHTTLYASFDRYNIGFFMLVASGAALETFQLSFGFPKDWLISRTPGQFSVVFGWNELDVFGPLRHDFGDHPHTVYNKYLQYLVGAQGNTSCDDVPFYRCVNETSGSTASGSVMRQLCPSRCGCDNPIGGVAGSPFAYYNDFPGCAAWTPRKKTFQDQLNLLPCRDTIARAFFSNWSRGLGQHAAIVLNAYDKGGCSEAVKLRQSFGGGNRFLFRLCHETSISAICPESCGCNTSFAWQRWHIRNRYFCPRSCLATNQFCFTIFRNEPFVDNGPYVGYACVFPFSYKGRKFKTCTDFDWYAKWCAVTVYSGPTREIMHWGYCPHHNCSATATERMLMKSGI